MKDETLIRKFPTQLDERVVVYICDQDGWLDVEKTRLFLSAIGIIPPKTNHELLGTLQLKTTLINKAVKA